MKLYLANGACSLASHIALHEADISFERVTVDLRSKRVDDGSDFAAVNAKGYVPALVLDSGELLTENVAILDWIAQRHVHLGVPGELGRTRLIEMLAFISTEIHKQFGRIFFSSGDAETQAATQKIGKRLQWLGEQLQGDYLFGADVTVADAYLYVMLRWASDKGLEIPEPLQRYTARMEARPAVQQALHHETLQPKA